MNFKLVFRLAGRVLLVEAAAMLLPLAVTLLYRENPLPFLIPIPILLAVGLALSALKGKDSFFPREGFFAVGLIWLLIGFFGALPFFCWSRLNPGSGLFPHFIDCFFESVSGFTTTGSSILTAVEPLPKGILFWRSFTHWLGGMGVLVLALALLPSMGSRSLNLMKAESPGPVVSKLVPKTSQSSKILYGIYCVLTGAQVIALRLAGMPWYDSVVHAFATAGTGGFSTRNLSVAAYQSPAVEIIITVFMLLFSINFALFFLVLCGKVKQALQSDELRFFLLVVAASTLLIAFNIAGYYPEGGALRHAAFQVATIISTTGFASADFNLWPEFSRCLLVILMFIGACAGSTGGGLKCSRVLLILRCIKREIRRVIHPRSVNVVKLDGRVVEEDVLCSVLIFFAAYLFIILGASLLVALDNFTFGTTFTAVVACISNIGPGLEMVGPMGNFSAFSGLSKLILSLCMIVGRLEVLPILVLLSGTAWKRS